MRAIILAGGKGTRLSPYTSIIPKPLLPIGGEMPVLEIIIRQLVKDNFTHITLAVNHLANLISAFFGDGSKWGIKIDYSIEDKPLGTFGPLSLIKDLPDNFLVMNGDLLCNLDYGSFLKTHCDRLEQITVSTFRRNIYIDFGVLQNDENNYLTYFIEKPTQVYNVSMGIYSINKAVVEKFPIGQPYGFDNLMLDSLKNNKKVAIKYFDGYWLDIGNKDDYQSANDNYQDLKDKLGLI